MPIVDETRLKPYLEEKLEGENLSITSVWKNLEGWSMETYSLGLSYMKDGRKAEHEIIIRKEPEGGLHGTKYDASIEYRVLTALNKIDLAVPETYWYEPDPEVMGHPFYVMEKVEGKIPFPPPVTFNSDFQLFASDEERLGVAHDFVKNLAGIHTADWKALELDFLGDPGPGTGSALKQVEHWEDKMAYSGFGNKPALVYAACWFRDNLVENDKPAIVHGDYRSGNFIMKDKGIAAILDWELVHLGDPLEDIAYALSAWRGAPPERRISHLLPEEEFFERYEEASGIKIDRDKLEYYILFHHYKAVGMSCTAGGSWKKHDADLKVGVFSMMQYISNMGLISHFSEQHTKKKGV